MGETKWVIDKDAPMAWAPLDLDTVPMDARITRQRSAISPQMIEAVTNSLRNLCEQVAPYLAQLPEGNDVRVSFMLKNERDSPKVDMRSLRFECVR